MSLCFYGLAAKTRSIALQKVFTDWLSRLAVREYSFADFLRTGGGPPGVLFFKDFFSFF